MLWGDHRVHNEAEGQEQGVLGEEQDQEEATDQSVVELIDEKVQNDTRLHDKEGLRLAPSWHELAVGANSNNHVDGHHEDLEHNPALL